MHTSKGLFYFYLTWQSITFNSILVLTNFSINNFFSKFSISYLISISLELPSTKWTF